MQDDDKEWREYLAGNFDPDTTDEEKAYSRAMEEALKSEKDFIEDGLIEESTAPSRAFEAHEGPPKSAWSMGALGLSVVVVALLAYWLQL